MNTILNDINLEPHLEPKVLESSANRTIRLSLATPIHVSNVDFILGYCRLRGSSSTSCSLHYPSGPPQSTHIHVR